MRSLQHAFRRGIFLATVLATVLIQSSWAAAPKRECQLSREENIFEPARWPEVELRTYATGKPGIIRPSYDHYFLFVAYRQLSGHVFNERDIAILLQYDPCKTDPARGYHGYDATQSEGYENAVSAWLKVRAQVIRTPPLTPPSGYRKNSQFGYGEFLNCHADALTTAARTLEARIATYGKGEDVTSWTRGQDAVFSNCASPSSMPEDVPRSAPRWLKTDRAYQQAAAAFYASRYDEAVERFDEIARTPDSPWREIAPYLAARAIIRKTTTVNRYGAAADSDILARAEERLIEMKSQPLRPALKRDVDRLLQFVQIRTRPDDMMKEFEQRFSAVSMPESFGQDLIDYWHAYSRSTTIGSDAPFTEWLDAMRGRPSGDEILAKWRARRTLPWLIAALSSVEKGSRTADDLVAAAEKVPPDSPAYLTVQFHLMRAAANTGKQIAIARYLLKRRATELSNQDANAIKAIASGSARNVGEFVEFAPRTTALALFGKAPRVDVDGATVLNSRLPLDIMEQIRTTQAVPTALRDELALVIWTRAFILKRWDISRRVAPHIKRLIPGSAPLVDEMMAAKNTTERIAIGAMLMARYPGMVGHVESQIIYTTQADEIALPNMRPTLRQESNRLNWWCSFPENAYWSLKGGRDGYIAPDPIAFLSRKQKQLFEKERAILSSTPNATDYLGGIVMAWAKQHPNDKRLPPALHRLVRSTRGGCIGDDTSTLSFSAFRHLHKYFPKDEWTRKTRVHY